MSNAADDAADAAADELDDDRPDKTIHVSDDLDEYVKRKRFDAIFDAKDEAREMISKCNAIAASKDPPPSVTELQAVRERAANKVGEFITETRQLFTESEAGRKLATEAHITTLPVESAAVALTEQATDVNTEYGLEPIEQDGRYYYVINGTDAYTALNDTTAVVEILVDAPGRGRGQQAEHVSIDPRPPVAVSQAVYRETTELLTTVGLDIELAEEIDDVADADYSDII